jgi:hypothetical protein
MSMRLAEEVIARACEQRDANGVAPFEKIIWECWPATKGGIGFAHARTRKEVRAAIREFYAPADYCREPTVGGQCG